MIPKSPLAPLAIIVLQALLLAAVILAVQAAALAQAQVLVDGVAGAQTIKQIEELNRGKKYDALAILCQEALEGDQLSVGQQAAAYHYLGLAAVQLAQPDAAYRAACESVRLAVKAYPPQWETFLRQLAALVVDASRLADLAAIVQPAMAEIDNPADPRVQRLALQLAELQRRLGDPRRAIQTLAPHLAAQPDNPTLMPLHIQCLVDDGAVREALDITLRLRREAASLAAMNAYRAAEIAALGRLARETPPAEARPILRQYMLAGIMDPLLADLCLGSIVDTFLAEARLAEAACEAQLLVQTCAPANLEAAVRRLATILKGIDGHLARANAYIEYQKFLKPGPDGKLGTDDDLTNPVADLAAYADPDRDALFQAALAATPDCWEGNLRKARLNKYWGRPDQALEHTRLAFGLAPLDDKTIQAITDETVALLYQLSGNPAIGETFVAYVGFGPNGPDGKPGTADDLVNPVAAFLPKPDAR